MNQFEISKHYRHLLAMHGDTPQAVQYSCAQSQERRFKILTEIGDIQNKKVLDFGCGTGQLGKYLESQGIEIEYYGTDIVDEFLSLCNTKFPNGIFKQFSSLPKIKFDYIFISGVFNNKILNNRKFYKETLRKLFPMCKYGIAFNMMSAYVDYQDSELFYEYPENVIRFIKREITPFVTLRNDYEVKSGVVPFDFTAYVYQRGQ
jgi:SAM-dependent methyltransferase